MKATATFYVNDPETHQRCVFGDGDEVPDHLAPYIGDHVVDQKPDAEPAEDEDDEDEAYDPSAHTADEVAAHLAGLDQDDEDQKAEYDRIVEAEKAGKNRSTAIPA